MQPWNECGIYVTNSLHVQFLQNKTSCVVGFLLWVAAAHARYVTVKFRVWVSCAQNPLLIVGTSKSHPKCRLNLYEKWSLTLIELTLLAVISSSK